MSLSTIFFLLAGFFFLIGGAKLLCDSTVHMVNRYNVNSIIVNVFLVSLGTSAPDFMSSITALLRGHPDISFGNILGSNFANLTLGFGIASMVAPFKCTKKMVKVEFPLLFAVTVFFAACCIGGKITRFDGILMLVAFFLHVLFVFSSKNPYSMPMKSEPMRKVLHAWSGKKSVCVFIISAILLDVGAHFVVTSCCRIANFFSVSKTFIGFSLLAFGTSAPEIFVVSLAAKKKHHFICSGNIVGSSLINLLLVGGICATVNPISLEGSVFSAEIIALIAVTMLAWYVFRMKRIFSRAWGIAFVATYFATMFLARG